MKWLKYIWILLLIWLVCSARTCNEDEGAVAAREEQYVKRLLENVEIAFTSDTMADSLLRAYEMTAIDKLNDFADYLKIISDTTLDLTFRKHAAGLVRALFINGQIELEIEISNTSSQELNTLDLLIDNSIAEDISCLMDPVGITVKDQFVRENDSTFTGTLSFFQKRVSLPDSGKIEDLSGPYIMDIYLMRNIKHFGIQQLGVWDVYLGAMEIR